MLVAVYAVAANAQAGKWQQCTYLASRVSIILLTTYHQVVGRYLRQSLAFSTLLTDDHVFKGFTGPTTCVDGTVCTYLNDCERL